MYPLENGSQHYTECEGTPCSTVGAAAGRQGSHTFTGLLCIFIQYTACATGGPFLQATEEGQRNSLQAAFVPVVRW